MVAFEYCMQGYRVCNVALECNYTVLYNVDTHLMKFLERSLGETVVYIISITTNCGTLTLFYPAQNLKIFSKYSYHTFVL